MNTDTTALIGRWLFAKARRQQRESGTLQAAANLRKQGVPLPVALLILSTSGVRQ